MAHGPAGDAEPSGPATTPRSARRRRESLIVVGAAVLVAVAIKLFVVQAYSIPSASMAPTLQEGDRILVCRICVRVGGVDRGDVIVFRGPDDASPRRGLVDGAWHWLGEAIGIASPPSDDFVKRVAGLPGDTVEIDRTGQLYVNGRAVPEPYLARPVPRDDLPPTTVPDGMLFVLGDNRGNSGDSRCEPPACTGLVPVDDVIGVTFLRIWPPSRMGVVR